ncbi:MAG: hypothetical protein DMG96_29735 [Acidobacteria bacterium]|nr:MAG: hypothetical protein DMG98_04595 [Acidobacteriota bacterium]PYV71060.1 MAG: hypothetical protein DMG96_29735 [Acidobacteriota bacterium]
MDSHPNPSLRGSAVGLFLFDVCEEMKLDEVRSILGARRLGEGLKHAAAEQLFFERPPVVEDAQLPGDTKAQVRVKYYDYGVVSILFEFPFAGFWPDLISLSSKWISGTDLPSRAEAIAKEKVARIKPALVKPYSTWLNEDYFIFFMREIEGNPAAAQLLGSCRQQIAQVVRGENSALSDDELREILQSAMSYYPNDLAVLGWNAAFVYDSAAGSETTLQLLEYANSQLLEFRHYDDLLTRELASVYDSLEKKSTLLGSWRLPGEASRLQTVLLDVTELTERADNAIKFLSDMFSARLYRLAASKIGVPDYKSLAREKLRTAEDLYRFLIDQFHQSRTFVLESVVVLILLIELLYVFHGKM